MEMIKDTERVEEIKKTARDRYYSISGGDKEIFNGVDLMLYHTTADGLNYHVVEVDKDSMTDDIGGLLEKAFHDIVDRTAEQYLEEVAYIIMGAIPFDELDPDLEKYGEYTELDLGYVIPGLIDVVEGMEVENEEDPHYTPSAASGDYGPSSPWNAPGMSVSDFI